VFEFLENINDWYWFNMYYWRDIKQSMDYATIDIRHIGVHNEQVIIRIGDIELTL